MDTNSNPRVVKPLKRIRLPLDAYRHRSAWHLTLRCSYGIEPFTEYKWVGQCLGTLRDASERYGFLVYAYCFMPDHLHLLVDNETGADVVQFVRYFKQLTGSAYRRGHEQELWQRRFFDRALRREETVAVVSEYVFNNPVEAGLVEEPGQYPYSGSFTWPGVLGRS